MTTETIFGYGSLVNGATHDYGDLHRAELRGWRREWHFTSLRDLAYLSASPDENACIKGVVIVVPMADPALENREAAYGRHHVGHQVSAPTTQAVDTRVFAIPKHVHRKPGANSTLLLSYIDVVVQGYHRMFGEDGVRDFFETTQGWGAPVIDDRSAPIYPRHQTLSREETQLTDHWLNSLSAVIKQL